MLQRARRTILLISFLLFPITFVYMSPALAIGGTYDGVASSGLLWWAFVAVSSLIVGRAFCSYACPLGGIQEALHSAADRPLRTVRYLKVVKYAIWAAWIGLIVMFAATRGGWSRVDIFYQNPGFPPYDRQAHIAFLIFALLPVVMGLLLGKRAFCHYLCFFAPLNIIGTKLSAACRLPALGVHVTDREKCTRCKRCAAACPMSLDVPAMVARGPIDHTECITCGSCASTCQSGALHYAFGSAGKQP